MLTILWAKRIKHSNGLDTFVTRDDFGITPPRPIHAFIFGTPAILSAPLSKSFKELITSFVYRDDVVPGLSLGLIRDFRNVAINLAHEGG